MITIHKYYRYTIITLIGLALPLFSIAQDTARKVAPGPLDWVMDNILFLSVGAFLVLLALAFSSNHNKMIDYQLKELMIDRGDYVEPVKVESVPFWKKIYDKAWALVPMEKEKDIDLGHEFDGIRELDNRLPPWWLYLFYATIVWAGVYVYVAHFSDYELGRSQAEEYIAEVQEAEVQQRRFLASQKNKVDETNVVALIDPADLDMGQSIYNLNCITCHGGAGEGGVGPNLTDPNWIHGGGIKNIFKTIKYGVPEKGMISWKSQLPPKAMQQVASYILTMGGTNPPNGKAPEGEIYIEPEEETDGAISMTTNQ